MDFIISRVVMSICALIVVGVLAGVVDVPQFEEPNSELADIADGLCSMMEDIAGSRADVIFLWTVPSLVSGEVVRVTVSSDMVSVNCAASEAFARPSCGLHLWDWDGSVLNRSIVEVLDSSSAPLQASSSDSIILESIEVELEDSRRSMLFVSISG